MSSCAAQPVASVPLGSSVKGSAVEEEALKVLSEGLQVRRVKRKGRLAPVSAIFLDEHGSLIYMGRTFRSCVKCTSKDGVKRVNVAELVEVREGYSSDGLHRASRRFRFQQAAPPMLQETNCFSIIYKHPSFVYKSVDFVARGEEKKRRAWLDALRLVVSQQANRNTLTFDESVWLRQHFRKADLNKNGKSILREIEFSELWKLLSTLNLQLSELYAYLLFAEVTENKKGRNESLNETEFFRLFEALTDLPEYRNALRLAAIAYNGDKNLEDCFDVEGLSNFIRDEQGFKEIDKAKVEAIIDLCETGEENRREKKLSAVGFRRLLQSRWGHIFKEGHECIFQDMDQPLPCYFIKSSHNTYLTGLQVRGKATVEGYISALRRGNRLLELDVHDGDPEPVITHRHTFINPISLRNALKCIAQYAFQLNPYPLILTIENFASPMQQRMMADIFVATFGASLYVPEEGVLKSKQLPSPNQLKNKILLRGNASSVVAKQTSPMVDGDDGEAADEGKEQLPRSPVDPAFGKLIALPRVKFSPNFYNDIEEHPANGSASLTESKVSAYLEAEAPMAAYTVRHLVKSYPKGIRQDSSNMSPMRSWLCGIQCVAMNCQTYDEGMDLVNGLFNINGGVGYVLKPKILLDGLDPRTQSDKVVSLLQIAIICGSYLPKSASGKEIVDPFVSLELCGIPSDSAKAKTRSVRNNGFNPVWNENFTFPLNCPEMAMLRLVVKDFDSTSANDYIGEFSVPVSSIRSGYSHVRLNTGFEHSPDDAASLFVRVAFDNA